MLIDSYGMPLSFNVMAKPAGASCNLGCRYCFYLGKAALYPHPRPRMANGLLETYIRQMLDGRAGQEISFAWQGGEPTLMGLAFYERAVELQRRLAPPGTTVQNVIQTNGTLLDEGWGAFLKEHDFLVGVSLDGPRDAHDAYRTDRAGRGSFDAVLRGVRILQRHGVAYNILTTVHAANGDRGSEVYRFLRDEVGATWMQFIPIVERDPDGSVTDRSVAPDRFGRFLCAVFDEWVRRDVGRIVVQEIEVAFAHAIGQPPALCVHAPTCGQNVALEHNGDLYSCDHFVDSDHHLGNIQETPLPELVGVECQVAFGQAKLTERPYRCRDCDVGTVCWGGCPKDRFVPSPGGEPPGNYLCPSYELFFRHVRPTIDRMASLVQRGQPASAIMPALVLEDARTSPYAGVGRNDPCPCGSGEKYKKCHGRASGPN